MDGKGCYSDNLFIEQLPLQDKQEMKIRSCALRVLHLTILSPACCDPALYEYD